MKKGLFITEDILKLQELTFIEKGILALYRDYCKYDIHHICYLTKEQIAEELGICEKTVQRTKKKLKELGYITLEGTNVIYTGLD